MRYQVRVGWDATPERTAVVTGARSAREVAAYLPDNYRVTGESVELTRLVVRIAGTDKFGWNLDDYVIPRLASGLMFATETTRGES